VLNDDKKRYTNRYRQPECFEKTEDAQKNAESNLLHPKRGSKLPRFCLDELHDAAKLEISKACATVQEAFKKIRAPVALDPDLAGPWNEQKALAEAKAAQVAQPILHKRNSTANVLLSALSRSRARTRQRAKRRILTRNPCLRRL
jgi:hypothetical protein